MRAEPVARPAGRSRARHAAIALQVVASLLVLGLLLREAHPHDVGGALREVSLGWLAVAMLVKVAALSLHELRTWWLVRSASPCSLRRVMGIGFLSGLLNFVLPVRAGDVAAMVMLTREEKVPGPVAVSAVFLVALLEAAALGLFLLVIFGRGLLWWKQALGSDDTQVAVSVVALVTLGGVLLVVLLGALGRLLGRSEPESQSPAGGPLGRLRSALELGLQHAGSSLGRLHALVVNGGLALLDVGLFLTTYYLLLRALQLDLGDPWFAAGSIMALSAVASLVLPPSLGAGTAASSVAALGLFGIGEPRALAYAALVWLVGNIPTVVLGLPPALRRIGSLGELLSHGSRPED